MPEGFQSLPEANNSQTQNTPDTLVAKILNKPQSTNTSGQGKGSVLPPEIKGWCWGASFWGPIWAVPNNVWIGLLTVVPYAGLIVSIILGLNGKKWAWQSRHWDSVEHFNKVQRRWAISGIIFFSFTILVLIIAFQYALSNLENTLGPEILNLL